MSESQTISKEVTLSTLSQRAESKDPSLALAESRQFAESGQDGHQKTNKRGVDKCRGALTLVGVVGNRITCRSVQAERQVNKNTDHRTHRRHAAYWRSGVGYKYVLGDSPQENRHTEARVVCIIKLEELIVFF